LNDAIFNQETLIINRNIGQTLTRWAEIIYRG